MASTSSAAAAASSSYSALLRRSKLASYHPSIEQVYVAHAGHKSRSQFGFKRPLPRSASAARDGEAVIAVQALDDPTRRTEWRPAVREASFVRKMDAVRVNIRTESDPVDGRDLYSRGGAGRDRGEVTHSASAIESIPLQSRFVPAQWGKGTIKPINELAHEVSSRGPNILAMSDATFSKLLNSLGERTDDFREFVRLDLAKRSGRITDTMSADEVAAQVESEPPVDLYAHVQENRLHLEVLLERFLALSASTTKSKRAPPPQVHPALALRYSTPTQLENALAPTVPGRILGPMQDNFGSFRDHHSESVLTSVLGHLTKVRAFETGGASSTTFFPDAAGERSNVPGQAQFRVSASVNATVYANKVLPPTLRRGHVEFDPRQSPHEPQALGSGAIDFAVHVPQTSALKRPIIGSPEYAGELPDSLKPRSSGSSYSPTLLSDLQGPRVGGAGRLDAFLGGGQRRSGADQRAWNQTSQALREERKNTDAKVFAPKNRGGQASTKGGRKGQSSNDLLMQRLNLLLMGGLGKGAEGGNEGGEGQGKKE